MLKLEQKAHPGQWTLLGIVWTLCPAEEKSPRHSVLQGRAPGDACSRHAVILSLRSFSLLSLLNVGTHLQDLNVGNLNSTQEVLWLDSDETFGLLNPNIFVSELWATQLPTRCELPGAFHLSLPAWGHASGLCSRTVPTQWLERIKTIEQRTTQHPFLQSQFLINTEIHSTYLTPTWEKLTFPDDHGGGSAALTQRPELAASAFSSYLSVFWVKASTLPSVTSDKKCCGHAERTGRKRRKAGDTGEGKLTLN